MGTVNTTTSATATAFGNQRKIDRTSNGVLWAVHSSSSNSSAAFAAAYSTDGGATWTNGGGLPQTSDGGTAEGYTPNMALHIDSSADGGDRAFVAYKDKRNGYIYFVTGVPNAARTAYTWSAAVGIMTAATNYDYPDIWAHREGSGWTAHIVTSISNNNTAKVSYNRLTITSGGSITVVDRDNPIGQVASANSNAAYAIIDGNHTGDGKTVAGGAPHLYVGWSAGATGSGYGIRFRKATYASGSWTWGTEREIDNTRYVASGQDWLVCFFDGTRVVIAGTPRQNDNYNDLVLYERDAADINTTTRVLIENSSGSYQAANTLAYGSATYDSLGNVFFFGADETGPNGSRKVNYRRWVRATLSLDAPVTFDATGPTQPYVSARRGPQGQAIDYVYTDGTASPYTVTSGRIVLNQNPTAPDLLTPADNATFDSATDRTVTFKPNDPDGDAASKVRLRYRPAGTSVAYAYLESTTAVPAGGTATVTIPANTWDGVIEWAAQSYDPSGAEGAWSVTRVITGVPAALAALTGGQGGTSVDVLKLYDLVQSERALRALSLV